MLSILGIDLTLIPWPILLLLISLIFWVGWYLYIFIPITEELEELKKEIPNINDFTETIKDISSVSKKLDILCEKESYANNLTYDNINKKLIEILEKIIIINTLINSLLNKYKNGQ